LTAPPKKPLPIARAAARLGAVQALYQMDIAQTDLADVLADFGSIRLGEQFEDGECGEADFALLRDIVGGVVREQRLIDRSLDGCLAEGWTLGRLDATARAILRAGAYELMFRDDIPAKVVISQYVDVAHAFFDGSEPGFINAALDQLARRQRQGEFGC
jgi:transcription antitermination protein NusB